ncbi:cysteine desulfurase family protein [Candidatus Margulisiibacteriota bacterium]
MSNKIVYLDHNATTPLHPYVKEQMQKAMDAYGNPSSLHSLGREAMHLVESARAKVAEFINADPKEIVFVGSGSEANNTVLSKCVCPSCVAKMLKNEVITTTIEHPCILETAKCLHEINNDITVKYLSVGRSGRVSKDELAEILSKKTKLVSIMMSNNEIGTIQDVKTFAKMTHQVGGLFHTDAAQAVGKIPVDVKALDIDFLTISGHKMYGPKGIGALYVKKGTCFCPLIRGGHQESGRRAGTENVLGIVGLGAAIEMRKKEMQAEAKKLTELKAILKNGIRENIAEVIFNSPEENCLPTTLNCSFYGAEGEAILLYLDLEGIAISTGSACASGSLDPSHVLLAIDTPIEAAHGSVRISMGRETTKEEINYTIKKLKMVIEKVRGLSRGLR